MDMKKNQLQNENSAQAALTVRIEAKHLSTLQQFSMLRL